MILRRVRAGRKRPFSSTHLATFGELAALTSPAPWNSCNFREDPVGSSLSCFAIQQPSIEGFLLRLQVSAPNQPVPSNSHVQFLNHQFHLQMNGVPLPALPAPYMAPAPQKRTGNHWSRMTSKIVCGPLEAQVA
jgi:hypothetical protein